MDTVTCQALQKQVQALCDKVDSLQTILGELRASPEPSTFSPAASPLPQTQTGSDTVPPPVTASLWEIHDPSRDDVDRYSALPHYLAHKDIIKDDETSLPFWSHTESSNMTPDIQIRRLTAQLTAAYHRIAALEEQIMAQRNHPLPTYNR
ncbi:MAG: hypothetical protein VKL20_05885 [Synechocystis sp.]|nr:hypothetical protein [Synechocystis sp.]